ncbi:zinc finger protein 3-like [Liolophura sinensis]|uniref:zinc finger protein 3-like n=1 Tax=Liolophura sinensis TaxID=3198878 RepID=UPI0031587DE6
MEAKKDVGLLASNQKFMQALISSLQRVCVESLDFNISVLITGNIIVNIDGSHIDVLEIRETVHKPETNNPQHRQNGARWEGTTALKPSHSDVMCTYPPDYNVRPRIDAEVQTVISHHELGFHGETKPCIFLNDQSTEEGPPHPTGYVIPHAYPQSATETERMTQLTGLQKLTGANRRKRIKNHPVRIIKETNVYSEDTSKVKDEPTSLEAEELSEVEQGVSDEEVEQEVSEEEEVDDVEDESEEKSDKDDPDFNPEDEVPHIKDKVPKRGRNPRRHAKSRFSGTQSPDIVKHKGKTSNVKSKAKIAKIEEQKLKKSPKKYSCTDCSQVFTAIKKLRAHQKDTHNNGGLKCPDCDKVYSCDMTLRRHRSSIHLGEKHPCEICGRTFTSPNTLYHHKRGEHSDKKPFNCDQCQRPFKFYHSYKLHMLQHKGLRPHKCSQCDKTYLTANHLKQHVQVVHANTRNYSCSTCGKKFGYLNSLKVHEKLHTSDRPYKCSECNKGFINLGALKSHAGRHVVGRHFKCDECGKFYKTEFLLNIHKRRHTAAVSRFMCDICGLTFMFKSNLEMHAAVHSDVKKFQCSECGKAFKTYPTLYSHQQCHNPVDRFKCSVCDKMFKTKGRCYAHEKRHTEQKKYQCNYCHKLFSSKGDMSKHKRTVHSDAKRFSCPMCGKPSARSDNLRVHLIRVHRKDPQAANALISHMIQSSGASGSAAGELFPQNQGNTEFSQVHPFSVTESAVPPEQTRVACADPGSMATMVPLHCNMDPSVTPQLPPQHAPHMQTGAYQPYSMSMQSTSMTGYWYQDS